MKRKMGFNDCEICGVSANLKCSSCKIVSYCGADHQKQHWKKHKVDCVPYEISANSVMVAKRDIPAGTQILVEAPLITGPSKNLYDPQESDSFAPCVGCFEPIKICAATARCQGCGCFACRVDCAGLENAQLHGTECQLFRAFGIRPEVYLYLFNNDALLMLKCLLLQMQQPKKWKQLLDMKNFEKERKNSPTYEDSDKIVEYFLTHFINNIKIFEQKTGKTLLQHCDKTLLHKVFGIIELHSMTINLINGSDLNGMYPIACALEHSCMPNCFYTFDNSNGFKICVRAARDIKKGEHLTAMSTQMLWDTTARREHLLATKYFSCECQRCSDPTELGTFFSGLQCLGTEDGSSCDGIILPVNPLSIKSEWACTNCKIPVSETTEINAMIDNVGVELEEARNPKNVDVKKLEELYEKLSEILHPNHLHMFNLKHTLIQTYGHQVNYLHEQLTDFQLSQKIAMCKELLYVLKTFDPYGIRLALYTAITMHEQCLARIEQQQRLLRINASEENKRAALKVFNEILEVLKKSKGLIKWELDRPQGLAFDKTVDKTIEEMRFTIATALMD